jgi:hypothetical protein
VVIGNTDWMKQVLFTVSSAANVDLLYALTGWLTERDELISIQPRESAASRAVVMTQGDVSGVGFRVLLLMPLAVLLLGIAVWWSRRS